MGFLHLCAWFKGKGLAVFDPLVEAARRRVTVIDRAGVPVGTIDCFIYTICITGIENSYALTPLAFVIDGARVIILTEITVWRVAAPTRSVAQIVGARIPIIAIPPKGELTQSRVWVAVVFSHFPGTRVSIITNNLGMVANSR